MQGKLLVVVELGTDPLDPGAVHYGLQPSDAASPADTRLAHLEVIRQVSWAAGRRQGAAAQWGLRSLPLAPPRPGYPPALPAGATGRLQPAPPDGCSTACRHLALRPQGKWLGFRSAATGDRFLQARKRSPNRLVFFSQNVGTWEQWELGAPAAGGAPPADPDAADWTSLALTLRHRRLPQYELAVEAVRVGTYSLPPSASVTPRSLLAGSGDTASAGSVGSEEDPTLERRELKRMSGVLLHVSVLVVATRGVCCVVRGHAYAGWGHQWVPAAAARHVHTAPCALPCPSVSPQEWLHYVDQEKAARLAIEARVAQMAEDAAGLREWAAMQVRRWAGPGCRMQLVRAGHWPNPSRCPALPPRRWRR